MDQDRLDQLLAGIRAGEPAALETLVEEWLPRVQGFVVRMIGPGPVAEELTQEVFVRVIRMLPGYQHQGYFTAWLFRIATNLVHDHLRRRRRESQLFVTAAGGSPADAADAPHDGDLVSRASDSAPGPNQPSELAEELATLDWAMAQLNAEEREAIVLRHFSEMSFKEIADVTAAPLGTVLARVHRGLKHLRHLMESHDGRQRRQRRSDDSSR